MGLWRSICYTDVAIVSSSLGIESCMHLQLVLIALGTHFLGFQAESKTHQDESFGKRP